MEYQTAKESALDYLERGWSVIPLRPRQKRPAIRWTEYQHRRASADEVKKWFHERPNANVGIVTGSISNLVVVDVDPLHGGDASIATMEKEHGALSRTIEAITGGGGRHIYFEHPGGVVHNRVGFLPGVDIRGDGGYVVAPPSVHASGRYYVWAKFHAPHQTALAPMPQGLLQAEVRHGGHPIRYWRDLVREGVREGERNNTVASFTGHLLWHGVDPEVALELLLCWNRVRCRPPLPENEVVCTVKSITRLHQRHLKLAADMGDNHCRYES